ncbi:STAS domain-containing protein [Aquincola sp. S2]|uniref:STAS domain-containing protein n=1 Tax=Pseudaquabacterium terrae TaxID=2732868 RepID=A0ABX2EBF0_9BURK|nr:STAS domain-containing protein [Aquabacterium terrae]NRF66097.1 STAS domain-containing protein [Aquabacterium terrae]
MADSKDGESFLRKVVRFVANPATDWSDINSRQEDSRDLDLERSELKAMVERKRRNDFVRKREFDMLRRLRREGLSPEQLAALGGSSRIDDSEVRLAEGGGARQDVRVKAKIDEIEQQMVGEGVRPSSTKRSPGFYNAPTQPVAFHPSQAPADDGDDDGDDVDRLPALPPLPAFDVPPAAAPAPAVMGAGMAPLRPAEPARPSPPMPAPVAKAPAPAPTPAPAPAAIAPAPGQRSSAGDFGTNAVEVSEVVHDPELDEAVIAFANADFTHCEDALTQLVKEGSERYQHPETWHVLFDLYRATGQQQKFEGLALDYANLFDSSSPQWYSLPKRVADAAAAEERPKAPRAQTGEVGWVCTEVLDLDAISRLRSATLQLPLPWVLDWAALRGIETEAASQLTDLFRQWAKQRIEMRWQAGEQLFTTLQEAAPTGVRDADPVFWMCRLEALRLTNRPDQFDETAIDYCVTYEVSPPSWERSECTVRLAGSTHTSSGQPVSTVNEVSTGFLESSLLDDPQGGGAQVATVELSGQLIGDIGATLKVIDGKLAAAPLVTVSCSRLIRVDFIAAGDLLNWVLAKRGQNRSVTFTDAHRLVALFFGAMGINEHARVQVLRD